MVEPSPPSVAGQGALFAALFAIALVFSPLLAADYVWDDGTLILANTALEGIDGLIAAWTGGLWSHTPSAHDPPLYYRPAMLWSLWLDHRLGGAAWLAHLQSVLWHLGGVALVGMAARRTGAHPIAAAGAAAFFGLHPAVVEPVAWVSARNDPMAAVGILGVLVVSLGPQTRARLGAVAALAAFAAASKESAYLLPLALWPVLFSVRTPWQGPVLASTGGLLGVGVCRWLAGVGWPAGADVDHLAASALPTAAWSLETLVWPGMRLPGAHLAWPEPASSVAVGGAVVGMGALVCVGGRRAAGFLAFAVLTAIPAWPAIAHVGLFGDRYLLLPLAGVALAIAHTWSAALRHGSPTAVHAVGATWLLALAIPTTRSLPAWRSDPALWTAAAELHANPHTAGSLAKVLETEGQLDSAAEWYRIATQPPRPLRHACWNIAAIHVRRGVPAQAAEEGERALAAGCAPDPELTCPTALGHAWTGAWDRALEHTDWADSDPTGLCTLVSLADSARSRSWSMLEGASGGGHGDRQALAQQLIHVLSAGGTTADVEAVRAWADGPPIVGER